MRRAIVLGLVAGLVAASGCVSTVAKQAFYGATGASGRYFEVRDAGAKGVLDRYMAVQVEAFDPAPMLGAIPSDVVAAVQPAIVAKVTEMQVFSQVGANVTAKPALLIRGKFMDYDPGTSAVRAVGLGADPSLTAQIQLIDAEANKVVGVAMVTGTVKSAVRTGPRELAEGVGKAVKGLLEAHMLRKPEKR